MRRSMLTTKMTWIWSEKQTELNEFSLHKICWSTKVNVRKCKKGKVHESLKWKTALLQFLMLTQSIKGNSIFPTLNFWWMQRMNWQWKSWSSENFIAKFVHKTFTAMRKSKQFLEFQRFFRKISNFARIFRNKKCFTHRWTSFLVNLRRFNFCSFSKSSSIHLALNCY